MQFILIPLMSIFSRQAGGGIYAEHLPKFLPELLFAIPFGIAAHQYGGTPLAVTAVFWSYLWMQTGHGTVLQWGDDPDATNRRSQFLSPLIDAIADKLNMKRGGRGYCRLFMAVKGFLIGLPVGGVLLAVLWPLAYEIGYRLRGKVPDGTAMAELIAGASAGLCVSIFLGIF